LYDPKSKKVVFNKDVKFDKSRSWHWNGKVSNKTDRQFYFFEPDRSDQNETENQVENDEVT